MTIVLLCYINLLNYMDRFTLAGVLHDVKIEFQIGDDMVGLLQTVFIIAYMVFAPLFGYLGDRYSRRIIIAISVALWCMATFVGSFIHTFAVFACFRCLVGIGEASYSTIAPTIISDLYVGNKRSTMLACFYFAIPVGSGLGYIVGSSLSSLAGNWRWALRVTPFLGVFGMFLIMLFMEDPERGRAEESNIKPTSYRKDLISLIKNPSFMLSTFAFTCVAFVAGALAWWGPQFIYLGLNLQPDVTVTLEGVSLTFGLVTMIAGLLGVPLGTWLGAVLIERFPRAHPILCGVGLLISAPALILAILLSNKYLYAPFILMFFGQVALNLNWAVVADIGMYVVIPPRRSTAEATEILISHLFGDAGSPYFVGLVSEILKKYYSKEFLGRELSFSNKFIDFVSLQYSLLMTCFVELFGGLLFLLTAVYIVKDKTKVERAIAEANEVTAQSAEHAQSP